MARTLSAIVLSIGLALGWAGWASAADLEGRGFIVAVDLENSVVDFRDGARLEVRPQTEIVDGEGRPMALDEVPISDDEDHARVTWQAQTGSPLPVATRITILTRPR